MVAWQKITPIAIWGVCLLAGCQQLQLAMHPIPVSLTPTNAQLTQRKTPTDCLKSAGAKRRQQAKNCSPNPPTNQQLFILQDWLED